MTADSGNDVTPVKRLVYQLIYPERGFIKLAIIYGLAISLLTLAVPIAVQTLINTVVNIASVSVVVTLAILLFITLCISGLLSALRTYTMEKYERHIYSRLTAEISVRTLMTHHSFFAGRRNVDVPNRYFDINVFQKNIPRLVIDGFALLLQLIVGFTLVSLYHPLFLLFCILVVVVLYLIWAVWARKAIAASVGLSHSKYATAKWLGDMAAAHTFFRSGSHFKYAQAKTEAATERYVNSHKKYFYYSFSQIVALLLLYAIASSSLLGLGGYLVIVGDLSIGQLVAAELILAAIFFGLSQAGSYLKLYYELCGAADEIGIIYKMPLNTDITLSDQTIPEDSALQFRQTEFAANNHSYVLDLEIPSGDKVYMQTTHAWLQRDIINVLKFGHRPKRGNIRLGRHDINEFENQQLNDLPIMDINKSPIVECTILEYLTLSAPSATLAEIQDALLRVGLEETIFHLEKGLDTPLSPVGEPLQPNEFLLLKLAAAILVKPKVVIITQYFDNLPQTKLVALLSELKKETFTVLYFTNHVETPAFDYCVYLDRLGEAS